MIYITTYPLTQRINPMRKLLLTTAAVAAAIGLAGCSKKVVQPLTTITYGTFTDNRDGQTYKTVTIGTQTWMAQNINYKTDSSWCYKNADSNCVKYGRLYYWNTAKTVCPNGWKLPDTADWNRLVVTVGGEKIGGKKLKSKSGWYENRNGTDDFGFSLLPSGFGYPNADDTFCDIGGGGYWWTATVCADGFACVRELSYHLDNVSEFLGGGGEAYSVRCVADRP
jgi:uncharacterized protein (TIGR02145 family)